MVKNLLKKFNWKLLVKIVFTFLGVGWVLSQIDVDEVGRYLTDVPVALTIACIVIFNLSKFFCSVRLNMFFKQDGVFISEKESLKLYYKGMFYNMMLPGGIGGDGYKGYYLHNTLQVPVKNLVRPILWDRITGRETSKSTFIQTSRRGDYSLIVTPSAGESPPPSRRRRQEIPPVPVPARLRNSRMRSSMILRLD